MADLTAEEQARLLAGQIPGGLTLSPPQIGYRYGAYSPEGMVHTQGATVPGTGVRQNFAEWMWGYDPSKGLEDPTTPAPAPAPAPPAEPIPIPPPQVMTAPGGGDSGRNTPSGISAYKTKDGKVFFTNQQAPEGTTPLSYEKGLKDIGAPGGGGFVFAQESPEIQQLKNLRDALLKQQMAEALMTPEDRIKLQINQQKQLGAAQTENKLEDMKKLGDMLMGTKLTDQDPVWKTIKQEFYDELAKKQTAPGFKGQKLTDQQLWEEAYRMTQAAAERKHARDMMQLYMIQNRSQMLPVMGE